MATYLHSTPGYYYEPIAHVLKRLSLNLCTIPDSCIFGKGVGKRLQRLQQIATSDLSAMEIKNTERWPAIPADPLAMITSDTTNYYSKYQIPHCILDIPTENLLGVWENLRKVLYGGDGYTVQGLSLAPPVSSYAISPRESNPNLPLRNTIQPTSQLFKFLCNEKNNISVRIFI